MHAFVTVGQFELDCRNGFAPLVIGRGPMEGGEMVP